MAPVLELRGITKHFGPVQALRGADFILEEGEIHSHGNRLWPDSAGCGSDPGAWEPATDQGTTRCPPTGHRHGAPALHIDSSTDRSRKHRIDCRVVGLTRTAISAGGGPWGANQGPPPSP